MARTFPLIAILALAGCDTPQSQGTKDAVARLEIRVIDLEAKVTELQAQRARDAKYTEAIAASLDEARANHDSLRKVVNGNAELDNKEALAEATARGRCGQEVVHYPDGGIANRNRECTWKLLGK